MRNDLMAKAVELDTTRQKAKKKEIRMGLKRPRHFAVEPKSLVLAPGFFFSAASGGSLEWFAAV